jgi:hypothetical protein
LGNGSEEQREGGQVGENFMEEDGGDGGELYFV